MAELNSDETRNPDLVLRSDQQIEEEKVFYGPVQDTNPKRLAVAKFSRLELHTNLREPPDNWLRGKKYFKVPRNWLNSQSAKFSSLLMADRYPETVTEVNVITASENIKKLLKMPFSKSQISMAVHRIDKTLLLDELDLYQHFGTSQSNDLDDWFYTFIRGILLQDGKNFKRRKKHKENSQKWNLLSKFLYHSIGQLDQEAMQLEQVPPETSSPEPSEFDFARQVLWKFEDISMLLGTDLPIFGGGTFPAVSLRLRDANSPINVLTGMDYWLDNLMCNVPELAMCYHLDGIVQRYEVIKTEEIPHISQAQFSPKVVKDVAQNILSFIKSNCTQEGHTYWLFKGNNDDVIKLYDLSSLSEDSIQRGKNPFVMPVILLLFKVAKNMSASDPNKRSVICKLLRNCISLLEETGQANTEIMAAATYLLSHSYLSNIHNEKDEDNDDIMSKIWHDEVSDTIKPTSEVDVRRLINPGEMVNNNEENVSKEQKSPEELAKCAVDVIVKGLKCIENCEPSKFNAGSQPIPLKYKTVAKDATRVRKDSFVRSTTSNMCLPVDSWQQMYKLDLLLDALDCFMTQAKHEVQIKSYGVALRHARVALSCFESVVDYKYAGKINECNKRISEILEVCGDTHLLMVDNIQQHEQEFNKICENETKILEHTTEDSDMEDLSWAVQLQSKRQDCLRTACICYESILDHYSEGLDPEMLITSTRKLGSARNELGIWFMNLATEKRQTVPLSEEQKLWTESFQCFEKALKAFNAVSDVVNVALLYNNMGRLMRICAQAFMASSSDGETEGFSKDERHYFNKAISYYKKSQSTLRNRALYPGIWDAVTWELSTTYFTMATTMQDNAPLAKISREEVEKEILHLMHEVLSLSESVEPSSSNAVLHQFRMANVYYRLASMYHSSLRNQMSDKKKRYTKSLADNYYEKAEKLFRVLERPTELLRVQLERVAMIEHQFHSQTGNSTKIKSLQCCLDILLQCKDTIQILDKEHVTSADTGSADSIDQVKTNVTATTSETIPEKETYKPANNLAVVRKRDTSNQSEALERKIDTSKQSEEFKSGIDTFNQSEVSKTGIGSSNQSEVFNTGIDSSNQSEVFKTEIDSSNQSEAFKSGMDTSNQLESFKSETAVDCQKRDTCTSNQSEVLEKEQIDLKTESQKLKKQNISKEGLDYEKRNTSTHLSEHKRDKNDSHELDSDDAEIEGLKNILKSRLQYVLLNLVKVHSNMKRNKENEMICATYKKMYVISLKVESTEQLTLQFSLTEIILLNQKLLTGQTAR
ncbi:erythroid differentiation-related factor 1-like [Antedon mediterranea]|uniref:erythroid differentiation-related factor 1-like n=1 Tax=Antedon mediterranea TaxID=105859 RepID=UPI003AF97662